MTLDQLHDLKVWHLHHGKQQPVETHVWDAVLTLWVIGWVGAPAALLIGWRWLAALLLVLVFLPGLYVAVRVRLHRAHRLRCDWVVVLKRV